MDGAGGALDDVLGVRGEVGGGEGDLGDDGREQHGEQQVGDEVGAEAVEVPPDELHHGRRLLRHHVRRRRRLPPVRLPHHLNLPRRLLPGLGAGATVAAAVTAAVLASSPVAAVLGDGGLLLGRRRLLLVLLLQPPPPRSRGGFTTDAYLKVFCPPWNEVFLHCICVVGFTVQHVVLRYMTYHRQNL